MANDGQKIEWWRVTRLQSLFERHAEKQRYPESKRSLYEVANRFADLATEVHNGSYGEIGGKPASLDQALAHVLKPMETVGDIAKNKFDNTAGDAFDEVRWSLGQKLVETLQQAHDQSIAAESARSRNWPSIH